MTVLIKEELKRIYGIDDSCRQDLFLLAQKNNEPITKEFEKLAIEIKRISKVASLEALMVMTEKWGLSVNMSARKISWICENKRICTTYDIAMSQALSHRKEFEESLKDVCKGHYELRIKFNKEIKDEERFKYTAFNIGSSGLQTFGEFCFCFDNSIANKLEYIAFIKGNSLDSFVNAQNEIEIERLISEVATKELVRQLVALKHEDGIKGDIAKEDWPRKICSDGCYVEGVVADDLKLSYGVVVKIEKLFDEQFDKTGLDLRYGEPVPKEDGDILNSYLNAKEQLVNAGIEIKIV